MPIASVLDFREAARRRLPRFLFEYIDGGSYAEVTLRKNVSELSDIALRQRVLRGPVTTSRREPHENGSCAAQLAASATLVRGSQINSGSLRSLSTSYKCRSTCSVGFVV